jgi:GGDEF domain-containing protein
MWTRYAYLIEVSKVMTHGPDYDPITSMPAYELGSAVEKSAPPERRPCGIVVATIGNLALLDELHGRAAHNHALFVCASRLRRLGLPGAELRRLREDGFLIVFRHAPDVQQLVDEARQIMRRLSRPVMLGTSRDITALEASGAAWQAKVGLGMLVEASDAQLEIAIAGARAMSRTALGFASGMAWYDEASGGIAELPVAE